MFIAKRLVHYNVMLNIQVKIPVLHKGRYYLGYVYFVIGKYKSPYFICNLWVLCKHIASVQIYSAFGAEYPTISVVFLFPSHQIILITWNVSDWEKKSISLACSSMSALFTSSQLCSTSRPVSQWNLPAPLKVCFSLPRAGDENRVWHFGKNHHARQSL